MIFSNTPLGQISEKLDLCGLNDVAILVEVLCHHASIIKLCLLLIFNTFN